MKKVITAVFRITLFEVLLFLSLFALKYWIGSAGMGEHIKLSLTVIGSGAVLIFLTALGVIGHLENQGYTVESWAAARPNSKLRVCIVRFVHWGQVLPVVFGYALILYIITPTSITFLIALFAGFFLRNIIVYLMRKKDVQSKASF